MGLCKITKHRSLFQGDEVLLEALYEALRQIGNKLRMPLRYWKAGLNRLTIQFEERLLQRKRKLRLCKILPTLDPI